MVKIYQNKGVNRKVYFIPIDPPKSKGLEVTVGGYEIICTDNGRWECKRATYYRKTLADEKYFAVVGEVKIDIKEYVKGAILEALERKSWNESN